MRVEQSTKLLVEPSPSVPWILLSPRSRARGESLIEIGGKDAALGVGDVQRIKHGPPGRRSKQFCYIRKPLQFPKRRVTADRGQLDQVFQLSANDRRTVRLKWGEQQNPDQPDVPLRSTTHVFI